MPDHRAMRRPGRVLVPAGIAAGIIGAHVGLLELHEIPAAVWVLWAGLPAEALVLAWMAMYRAWPVLREPVWRGETH
jgi:hypothetical protein